MTFLYDYHGGTSTQANDVIHEERSGVGDDGMIEMALLFL